MKTYEVQTIEINAPFESVFSFIADAQKLPEWASAFKSVSNDRAVMQTPNGAVEIKLEVKAACASGTIDWVMTFPDASVATAFSRVVALGTTRSLYSFILTPPPVPLEQLEGTLEAQSHILREELAKLRSLLEQTYCR